MLIDTLHEVCMYKCNTPLFLDQEGHSITVALCYLRCIVSFCGMNSIIVVIYVVVILIDFRMEVQGK